MMRVAALYVDPLGPYARLPDVDAWDLERDAKQYDGPYPVVAHPPCGPWSWARSLASKDDPECALRAVQQVQAYGGILEHPANSKLWRVARLPLPGEFPDVCGGFSVHVNQVSWGHSCRKPTWLYIVGVPPEEVHAGVRRGGKPTHIICTGPGLRDIALPVASKQMKRRTPPAFAEWLVSLARRAATP
jgi:hypothetical protein